MKQFFPPALLALSCLGLGPRIATAEINVVSTATAPFKTVSLRPGQAEAAYTRAVTYLRRSRLAAGVLDRLENSPVLYTVQVVDPALAGSELRPAEFDPTENVIRWDPRAGLEWKAGQAHSAAVVLLHELGHAFHKDVNAPAYWRRREARTRDKWGDLEEKRTIQEIENPVARALRESERDFHEDNGSFRAQRYEVANPTTTRRAQVKRPTFDYLF